jgi:hypothetical protein
MPVAPDTAAAPRPELYGCLGSRGDALFDRFDAALRAGVADLVAVGSAPGLPDVEAVAARAA